MVAIVKVNEFEEAGDRLYCAAMRRLYCEIADPTNNHGPRRSLDGILLYACGSSWSASKWSL
jgi:hypothetical protein